MGDYKRALDYFTSTLKEKEKIGDKNEIGRAWCGFGIIYLHKGNYKTAKEYLEKSLSIAKELDRGYRALLIRTILVFLCYKKIGKEYNVVEIQTLIKKQIKIVDFHNYFLYQLLEDTSFLETAYNQIQEKAGNLELDVAAKFLSYPIPKAIVEEWEKVN